MCALSESFNAKNICSRVLWRECQLYSYNNEVAFLDHPLGDLEVTCAIHLQLAGKLVIDFPQVIIGTFFASSYGRSTTGEHTSKSKLCRRLYSIKLKFYSQKRQNRFLNHSLGELGVTYALHLQLVGNRVLDFLFAIIENVSLALRVQTSEADD